MKRILVSAMAILVGVLGIFGASSASAQNSVKVQPGRNDISISARVDGLGGSGSVSIYGGLIPKDKGTIFAREAFKINVKHNGVFKLPVRTPGKWEIRAASSRYGEIPEAYIVSVDKGEKKVLKFRVGKTLPVESSPVSPRGIESGTKVSYIGRIRTYKKGETKAFVLQGSEGYAYYQLKAQSINLKKIH